MSIGQWALLGNWGRKEQEACGVSLVQYENGGRPGPLVGDGDGPGLDNLAGLPGWQPMLSPQMQLAIPRKGEV